MLCVPFVAFIPSNKICLAEFVAKMKVRCKIKFQEPKNANNAKHNELNAAEGQEANRTDTLMCHFSLQLLMISLKFLFLAANAGHASVYLP